MSRERELGYNPALGHRGLERVTRVRMKRYRINPSPPLRGRVQVPGDKSIGHRALMFAALSDGACEITGLSGGTDNLATAEAFQALGVEMKISETSARIHGVGIHGLRMAPATIDCSNSGTGMRLLAGLLSGQKFGSRLAGDASLTRRPMGRVVTPLRARGAHIRGAAGKVREEHYAPLSIAPLIEGETLQPLEYEMPVASAQVKSALLLSGLYSSGMTALREPVVSRDHTERMMHALGIPLQTAGSMVVLDPADWNRRWEGFAWHVPGDLSSAAFVVGAAASVPGSRVSIEGVGVNPTRTGVLDAFRPMGVSFHSTPKGAWAGDEPVADIEARASDYRAASIGGELLVRMIDEIPCFCAVAASARGTSLVRDASELRVKESDRIATMAEVLSLFGVPCREFDSGMEIEGGRTIRAAEVDSRGDHRIAMAATLLALRADGESVISDVGCVDTSFPGFAALLRSLGAPIEEEDA
ncbi:MAG: 3-phosphoshikimate 1-carboxyvinyltransferase [Myxococcota bacterium]